MSSVLKYMTVLSLFLIFLFMIKFLSRNGLISFRFFLTVSYYLCQDLFLGIFPVNLFSATFLKSDPSACQMYPTHSSLFLTKKCRLLSLLYSCCRFSFIFLWKLSKSLLYTSPYIFLLKLCNYFSYL